jgi:hypothetical protein
MVVSVSQAAVLGIAQRAKQAQADVRSLLAGAVVRLSSCSRALASMLSSMLICPWHLLLVLPALLDHGQPR